MLKKKKCNFPSIKRDRVFHNIILTNICETHEITKSFKTLNSPKVPHKKSTYFCKPWTTYDITSMGREILTKIPIYKHIILFVAHAYCISCSDSYFAMFLFFILLTQTIILNYCFMDGIPIT